MRKAPERYTVDEGPQMHKSHSEEQRKLAHHLDAALPPRPHSGDCNGMSLFIVPEVVVLGILAV